MFIFISFAAFAAFADAYIYFTILFHFH